MNWESIILAVLGLGVFGDIAMRLLFKSDRRIADSKADVAEAEAEKARYEANAESCRQYEERIAELHGSVAKLNEQLDHYIERDTAKEERFDLQTAKLRDVQRQLLASTQKETELTQRIGELQLELERKRCDDLPCPFRQPPNVHTVSASGLSKEDYFKQRKR